ncbi:MAG: hypothetical protein CMF49_08215 [Legionellales bacterium]|nr:hypothetical protein [Legionellales bacterium]|tara:strand:+ start:93 stop:320 length:228 start_codon:yes stop_codon:yes gene_type:complete
MNLLDVIKANIFGEGKGQTMSDAQLANFLAIDIFEREKLIADEQEINFLEKRLRAILNQLNKTLVSGEVINQEEA